jgi:hypothetical protein
MNQIINRLAKALAFFLAAATAFFGILFEVGTVKILIRTLAVYLFFLYEIRFLGRIIGRMVVSALAEEGTTSKEENQGQP